MVVKTLVKKEKSAEFVYSAATTHAHRVAAKLAEEFPGTDRQRTRDAIATFVDAISIGVKQRFDDYEKAERALAIERSDDAPIAAERNAAGSLAVSLLVEVREAARNVDPALPKALGFKGDTPREPGAALSLGRHVVERLSQMKPVRSKVLRNYVFDPVDYADLGHAVTRLEAAQAAWITDGRENDAAMVDRNTAEEHNDRTLSSASSILSALLKAAGEPLLASRVGAPGRTRGTIAEFDEAAGEDKPEEVPAPVAETA